MRNLIKMGVPEDLAMQAGNTRHGHWFATHTVAVNMAMTKERLISGFYDLATAYQSVRQRLSPITKKGRLSSKEIIGEGTGELAFMI